MSEFTLNNLDREILRLLSLSACSDNDLLGYLQVFARSTKKKITHDRFYRSLTSLFNQGLICIPAAALPKDKNKQLQPEHMTAAQKSKYEKDCQSAIQEIEAIMAMKLEDFKPVALPKGPVKKMKPIRYGLTPQGRKFLKSLS